MAGGYPLAPRQHYARRRLDEPLAAQSIVGLNEDALHRLSHQPLRYLDHDHLVPEASHGRDAALLNLLRCKIRETETVAAQVFITLVLRYCARTFCRR